MLRGTSILILSGGNASPLVPRFLRRIFKIRLIFAQYMKRTRNINRVSVERVASGSGLTNVYEFLAQAFPERIDKAVDDGESPAFLLS